jgi:transcriptional regulator with XRE-family HTH domain
LKKQEIGFIIFQLRTEAGISQHALCEGLCTNKNLSKIELGEGNPSTYLLEALLQRLGKSPDKLEIVLSEEEYIFLQKREEIEGKIRQGLISDAQELLDQYQDILKTNAKFEWQYFYKIKAVLEMEKGESIQAATAYLIKAVSFTVPQWEDRELHHHLLSVEEVQLLLLLGKQYERCGDVDKAEVFYRGLFTSLKRSYTDEEEKVKVYPQCAYFLAALLWEKGDVQEVIEICEEAIDLLTSSGVIHYLVDLLDLYILALEEQGEDRQTYRFKKQREAIIALYKEYEVVLWQKESHLLLMNTQKELHLCTEMIRDERVFQGISQEELCEEICTPEALSRIENGKANPSHKNFYKLMQKLKINRCKYGSFIDVKNYHQLEKDREVRLLMSRHEYERAYEIFKEIKTEIDQDILENKQYILSMEAILAFKVGRISEKEALAINQQALALTYKNAEAHIYRIPLSQETVIFNQIAIIYKRLGKRVEAIRILESLLKKYEKSKIDMKYHYPSCAILMMNLAAYLEEEDRFQESIGIARQGIRLSLKCGKGNAVGVYLTNIAYAMERRDTLQQTQQNKKTCAKYFRQAFYLSDLMQRQIDREVIRSHYEKNYSIYPKIE